MSKNPFDLKKFFSSGARVKILQHFLKNPNEKFFIRELVRILDEQINSLRRELLNLEEIGLLKSKEKDRKKFYFVDENFPFLYELTTIILKCDEKNWQLLKNLTNFGNIEILILSGKFLNKKSAVDLFVVGEIDKNSLRKFLDEKMEQKITFSILSKSDFLAGLSMGTQSIKEILADTGNLVLRNKLKKEIEKVQK